MPESCDIRVKLLKTFHVSSAFKVLKAQAVRLFDLHLQRCAL